MELDRRRHPSQSGRTFIVTGANSGLGYVTIRELARHGGHVIMTARDQAKGGIPALGRSVRIPAPFLRKPFGPQPLLAAVRQAISSRR
jgi:NAD(P)-dependent dehydrogenase (short-subunit alcohol dehydrogenase family)